MAISPTNRRITLTLPASTLEAARRLALKRKVQLSIVVNEGIEEGLRQKLALEGDANFVERMSRAFDGLTEEELQLVNGIHLAEPTARRCP